MAGTAAGTTAGIATDEAATQQHQGAEAPSPSVRGPAAATETAATKQPPVVAKKPVQVPAAAASTADSSTAGNAAAAVPSSIQSSSVNKRTLQALFPEGSTVSVLSKEGSELPGSRPPAQLHAALDGHDRGQLHEAAMDEEEQEEIQKIISEIHGNGDESDQDVEAQDEPATGVKHEPLAGGRAGSENDKALAAATANPVASQQHTVDSGGNIEAQQPVVDSAVGVGAAAQPPGAADDATDEYMQQQQAQQQVLQDPQHEGIEQSVIDNSLLNPAAYSAGLGPSSNMAAEEYAESYALGMGPEGLIATAGYQEGAGGGGDAAVGVSGGDDDERSKAIAEQLAQLHEESRRLQLQSQLLQHRAMEMSLQMTAGAAAPDTLSSFLHPTQHHHHHLAAAGSLNYTVTAADQQGLTPKPDSGLSNEALGFSQAITPEGLALNPDALGLGDAVLPRHPPGDSTPSSVVSSRAGLNWKIPSRGSVASPSKMDAFGPSPASPYLLSAGAPRSSFNTVAQGLALHADPSMDYQMYSYQHSTLPDINNNNNNSRHPEYDMQQQQQQDSQHDLHLQQQHQQQHASPGPPVTGRKQPVAAAAALSAAGDAAAHHKVLSTQRQPANSKSGAGGKGSAAVMVRRPTLPIKQGSGTSTRVVAAGATAGRRSSCDNGGSYYGLVDDPAVVGTFNAVHAVSGAHGKVAQAKQQEAIGKVSPRGAAAAGEAAAAAAGKGAGNTSTAAAASKHGSSNRTINGSPGAASHRSRSVSPTASHTAAALAAAAAAASGAGPGHAKHRNAAAVTAPAGAGQWNGMPADPYAAAAAAAAMYGGYAPINPAMMPVMMKGPMQPAGNTNNKHAAAGRAGALRPEALAAMAAAVPPGAAWMPVGVPPGFMPMMPQGHVSPGSKGGLGPNGYMMGPMMTAGGAAHGPGAKKQAGHHATVPVAARKGQQMQAGLPYLMPGVSPAAFMGMPLSPAGFVNPYAVARPNQGGMGPGTGGNAAGKMIPTAGAAAGHGRAGKGPAAALVAAGGFVPAGYVPAAAGYQAGGVGWNPMLGAAGQFGMVQMYNPVGGNAPGVMRQQQVGKAGMGAAGGGKGGWQA